MVLLAIPPVESGGKDSPPKFGGSPKKDIAKQGVVDTPHVLNLGEESSSPKIGGVGWEDTSPNGQIVL